MELIDAIKGRRSIREFKSDPVPMEILRDILEAGNWAPRTVTSGGSPF